MTRQQQISFNVVLMNQGEHKKKSTTYTHFRFFSSPRRYVRENKGEHLQR